MTSLSTPVTLVAKFRPIDWRKALEELQEHTQPVEVSDEEKVVMFNFLMIH